MTVNIILKEHCFTFCEIAENIVNPKILSLQKLYRKSFGQQICTLFEGIKKGEIDFPYIPSSSDE